MISAALVRQLLVDRLATVFTPPSDPGMIVRELMQRVSDTVTDEGLITLANQIVQTRKAKSFPSVAELTQGLDRAAQRKAVPVSSGQAYDTFEHTRKGLHEREGNDKVRDMAGTSIARLAIKQNWAVGLTDFVREHLRAPTDDEIPAIRQLVRENDTVKQNPGYLVGLIDVRRLMHQRSALELTLEAERPDTRKLVRWEDYMGTISG